MIVTYINSIYIWKFNSLLAVMVSNHTWQNINIGVVTMGFQQLFQVKNLDAMMI